MENWLKSWAGPLLLILGVVLFGVWWILIFTEVKTMDVVIKRNGLPDTTYVVAPYYTKYYLDGSDTIYIFYDKNKTPILKYSTNEYK